MNRTNHAAVALAGAALAIGACRCEATGPCSAEFEISDVGGTTQSFPLATVEAIAFGDRLEILLAFDPETVEGGTASFALGLVGDDELGVLSVGQEVRARVDGSGSSGEVELLDPADDALLLRAGSVNEGRQGWRKREGVALTPDVFVSASREVSEDFCQAGAFDGGRFAGIEVAADSGIVDVAAGESSVVTVDDVEYVVGTPWSFVSDNDLATLSLAYLWRK